MSAAQYPSEIAGVGGSGGGKTGLAELTRSQVLAFPDEVRAELAKPEYRDRFFAAMRAGLQSCDRTCMRLYAEAHKLVGQQVDLSVLIVNQIGTSAPIARASVESIDRAKMLSPRQRMEMHAKALRENGWKVEPPADWSEAVEVNGNGGPHG